MFLVLTVLGRNGYQGASGLAGLAIGLVLTLIQGRGIPITNTSVNPARSLGPAVFLGGWALWTAMDVYRCSARGSDDCVAGVQAL